MKSISQIRQSSFPSHFFKTENCFRSSEFEIPWQPFTCAPTAVALFSSTRPPGFNPYMGREEKRVQGLDYKQQCVILFFLCKHTNDDVFDDFPKIFQNSSEGQRNVAEHFLNICEHFPKIADDDWRRPEDIFIVHCWSIVDGTKEKCHQKSYLHVRWYIIFISWILLGVPQLLYN